MDDWTVYRVCDDELNKLASEFSQFSQFRNI